MLLSSPPASTHLGQIMTRSWNPTAFDGTNKYFLSRCSHINRSATRSFQIALPNWSAGTSGDTAPAGASSTIWCSEVELNGAFTQITWNGGTLGSADTVTIANGTTLLSDAISLSVGVGDIVRFRIGVRNPNFLLFGGGVANTTLGDAIIASASAIAYTTGDTITTSGTSANNLFVPCAIVAQTNKPSIAIVGHSIPFGSQDTPDSTGDLGYVARSIGSKDGYINFSISGNQATSFTAANSPRRLALISSYCTHVISDFGINDYEIGGVSAATLQTRLQTHWTAFDKPVYACTLAPASTSSDSFRTVGNQTQRSYGANRITTNNYIRGAPSPLAGVFDPCTTFESSADSGFFIADGSTNFKYTPDGLHPNTAAIALAVANNVIPPSTFVWP